MFLPRRGVLAGKRVADELHYHFDDEFNAKVAEFLVVSPRNESYKEGW
jgi:hypothetical protein